MIRKGVKEFSEKIMPEQEAKARDDLSQSRFGPCQR
jgi:hypothetical protein